MGEEERKIAEKDMPLKEWVDLKLRAFRSEMRLLVIASVAGNQVLSHLSLPSTASALSAGAIAAGLLAKVFLWH